VTVFETKAHQSIHHQQRFVVRDFFLRLGSLDIGKGKARGTHIVFSVAYPRPVAATVLTLLVLPALYHGFRLGRDMLEREEAL
jgi:hypothetical protein